MATTDDLHNELMYKHFAWFEKNIASPKVEREYIPPHKDPFFQDSNGEYCVLKHEVWEYYANELLPTKRKLESVSWEESLLEHDVITYDRYKKKEESGTLNYPFKSE